MTYKDLFIIHYPQIPSSLRQGKSIKPFKVDFDEPKQAYKALQDFTSTDELRPALTTITYKEMWGNQCVVATDAHKMAVVKVKSDEYNGKSFYFGPKDIDKNARQPDHEAVVPTETEHNAYKKKNYKVDVQEWLNYLYSMKDVTHETTNQIVFLKTNTSIKKPSDEPERIGMNIKFGISIAEFFLKLGYETFYVSIWSPTTAFLFTPNGKHPKNEDVVVLCMPVWLGDPSDDETNKWGMKPDPFFKITYGVTHLDWKYAIDGIYSFEDNKIHTQQGKYDILPPLPASERLIDGMGSQQTAILKKIQKTSNLPITDMVLSKKGMMYVTNFEAHWLRPTGLPDGLYTFINNIFLPQETDPEEWPLLPGSANDATERKLFSVDNSELSMHINVARHFPAKNELQGLDVLNFKDISDEVVLMATDAFTYYHATLEAQQEYNFDIKVKDPELLFSWLKQLGPDQITVSLIQAGIEFVKFQSMKTGEVLFLRNSDLKRRFESILEPNVQRLEQLMKFEWRQLTAFFKEAKKTDNSGRIRIAKDSQVAQVVDVETLKDPGTVIKEIKHTGVPMQGQIPKGDDYGIIATDKAFEGISLSESVLATISKIRPEDGEVTVCDPIGGSDIFDYLMFTPDRIIEPYSAELITKQKEQKSKKGVLPLPSYTIDGFTFEYIPDFDRKDNYHLSYTGRIYDRTDYNRLSGAFSKLIDRLKAEGFELNDTELTPFKDNGDKTHASIDVKVDRIIEEEKPAVETINGIEFHLSRRGGPDNIEKIPNGKLRLEDVKKVGGQSIPIEFISQKDVELAFYRLLRKIGGIYLSDSLDYNRTNKVSEYLAAFGQEYALKMLRRPYSPQISVHNNNRLIIGDKTYVYVEYTGDIIDASIQQPSTYEDYQTAIQSIIAAAKYVDDRSEYDTAFQALQTAAKYAVKN